MEPNHLALDDMTDGQREAYFERCESRSKAEFRMMREACGIDAHGLANILGIRIDTVKKWEIPGNGKRPSLRAWAYLDARYELLLQSVETAIQTVEDIADEHGEPREVHVAYYRGRMVTRDGMTTNEANAAARAAVIALTALGYDAKAEWADEGAAGMAARAPRGVGGVDFAGLISRGLIYPDDFPAGRFSQRDLSVSE